MGTVHGKKLSGKKGTMQEGGSLVPMIVNWPAMIKKDRVSDNLVDASDFVPTFAELAGAPLPDHIKFDGKSLASEIMGKPVKSREWIFIELGNQWYVRSSNWKLDQSGNLIDMRAAPFEEKLAILDGDTEKAKAYLQAVLDSLNPKGGILDKGDGSGRHAGKKAAKDQ